MDNNIKRQPLLIFKFAGSAIHDGRILYDDLATFVSNISLTIDRLINKIQTGESIKSGRPYKKLQSLSALEIVSVRKGSFAIKLDLRRNGQQFPGWDVGEQAIDILLKGIESLNKDKPLPDEYDHGVLISLREAGKIIDRGVEGIRINSNSSFGKRKAIYSKPVREQVITKIHRFEQSFATVEGRLLSIDAKEDRLKCRIEPSVGEPILCQFDESMTEQVLLSVRNFVQARGEATYDVVTNKITMLYLKDLETIDQSLTSGIQNMPLSSFWKSLKFDELAAQQGVYPLNNLSNITGGWPEDEDVDSFLNSLRGSR
ncbi:hypothetical protein ACFLX5_05115 [Chloroflexota bacterium]